MMDSRHISQEDLALYAMRSLAPEEAATIGEHLATCARCRQELAETTGDLALLTLSAEQHPLPEGARQRLLTRIATAPLPHRETQQRVAVPVPQRSRRGAIVWAPWVAVAALVVLAIVLGARVSSLNNQLRNESRLAATLGAETSHSRQVLDVLTSPKAQRVVLTPASTSITPSGRVIYLPERGGLIFEAAHLQPLPQNKTYELWIIPANGKAPIPAGIFRPNAQGMASLVLPPIPTGVPAKAFGITAENAGGSLSPTLPILLSGAVPGA